MILCCGEALIDMIPPANGSKGFVPHPGGAVFNTSMALGRLDQRVALLTGLSRDMFGAQLEAELHRSYVATDYLIRSERPSTLAFVELQDGQARYSFFDENSAGRMIGPADLPDLGSDIDTLFFGGISLVCEPGAEAYLHLAEREAGQRVIMVDPNIRTGFITDETRYRARLGKMLTCADIVKVSNEDLAWLQGHGDTDQTAHQFREDYACLLIVTRGKDGATAVLPDGQEVSVQACETDVADTVGAGDAFNAGFLAALRTQGKTSKYDIHALSAPAVEKALSYAARVAALTVSKPGADPPWSADLQTETSP